MTNLSGKTALITGASRGIGKAIALLYADYGCSHIVITDLVAGEQAAPLLQELESKGSKALYIKSNAADFDAAHEVIKQVVDTFGSIDILVCNAGITRDTLLMRMNEQQWDDVLTINLKSVFNFCHAATPYMMRQRSGSIIAMSSVVGVAGNAGQANYAASKAGIIGFIKSLSKELGARNIRANAIAPGFILTDMTLALPEQVREEMVKMVPMRRCGDAEEVAKVALFLASDLSSYVSGQVISVNGAMG
jgi:3-oxoacyl-[acyl-carrier protein] reductase